MSKHSFSATQNILITEHIALTNNILVGYVNSLATLFNLY